MKSYAEHEGKFDPPQASKQSCPRCKQTGEVILRLWSSDDGAFEDEKYTCNACQHSWWLEGSDA